VEPFTAAAVRARQVLTAGLSLSVAVPVIFSVSRHVAEIHRPSDAQFEKRQSRP
jgi:hypothetical protein